MATSTDSFEFVELLARSNFSFLQGASHPEDLIFRAQTLGYRGLALCDLNGLYGTVRAFQAVEQPSNFLETSALTLAPFSFYCGAEMTLNSHHSVSLLPMHKDGYTNLCQLLTHSKRQSTKYFSNLDIDTLNTHSADLIALALPPWSLEHLKKLHEIFSERLFLAVHKDYTWDSLQTYNQALELEKTNGFQLVATQRPLMATADLKPLHDVITCIFHHTTLKQAKTRLLSNRERYLKPLPELYRLWKDRPDLIKQTLKIAEQLQFSLKELRYEYPVADCPPEHDSTSFLRKLVEHGLTRRFPEGISSKVRKTVEHELSLITELRYEDYFLTLWDICQFALQKNILHQGRGSAANSIVCYALGLTSVNPTQVELLFERFISKERGEPPDIDIDFEHNRREEIIQYIYQKYGANHAAMVCTVICFRARMALREVGKVFALPLPTINKMIKFMGRDGLARLAANPHMATAWNISAADYEHILRLANDLKGFPRHLGIHTGGFLIARRPITEIIPVEKATMDQRYVIQWNKDDLTTLKMLKIDVLGLGMLSALQKCFQLLQTQKIDLTLYNIPPDDHETYRMIQTADTVGTFQIESRAQMSLLPRLKPKNFYDLVIEVAIVRPGPIQGGMIHPFLKRREGLEPIHYAHPDLIPILQKTSGVPIFQEQIMQIASAVCGFTPGEADELRRIMSSSWKKQDLMEGLRQRLLSGMLSHGISRQYAEQIFRTILGFASYGFPESHAASFAILTYASCYIKQHHPEVFVVALLNSQPMGFYSPRALIADAQRHGVRFLPLCVQISDYDYTLEANAVRVGFRAIYGLHERHIKKLISAREAQQGRFRDFASFIAATELPKSILLRLASAGALASFGLSPREALWKIQSLDLKQESLFFTQSLSLNENLDAQKLPSEGAWDQLAREYHTHGYSLTKHPIGLLRPTLSHHDQLVCASQLLKIKNGVYLKVAGLLSLQQRPPTAKGFAFLSLEDETGIINVVLTPAIYEEFRLVISQNPLLLIEGRLENFSGVANLKAQKIQALTTTRTPQANSSRPALT